MFSVWIILLRVVWVGLVLVSAFMTLLMFAFADSPDAGKAAQKLIGPIFVIAIAIFAGSGWLMWHGPWWSIPCALALTITPPLLVFLGYKLLMK